MTWKGFNLSFVITYEKPEGLYSELLLKLLMTSKVGVRGIQIPITSEFYNPILSELETLGSEYRLLLCRFYT